MVGKDCHVLLYQLTFMRVGTRLRRAEALLLRTISFLCPGYPVPSVYSAVCWSAEQSERQQHQIAFNRTLLGGKTRASFCQWSTSSDTGSSGYMCAIITFEERDLDLDITISCGTSVDQNDFFLGDLTSSKIC